MQRLKLILFAVIFLPQPTLGETIILDCEIQKVTGGPRKIVDHIEADDAGVTSTEDGGGSVFYANKQEGSAKKYFSLEPMTIKFGSSTIFPGQKNGMFIDVVIDRSTGDYASEAGITPLDMKPFWRGHCVKGHPVQKKF